MKKRALLIFGLVSSVFLCSSCSSIQAGLYVSFIDKYNGVQVLENEGNVRFFLENIIINPADYDITAYERTGIKAQLKRSRLLTHSYFLITNTRNGEFNTLSYYGTKIAPYSTGAWTMNSDSDVLSYMDYINGNNGWDVKKKEADIDTLRTTKNIIGKMDSDVSYYYRAHIKKKPGFENCNTALWDTLVLKYAE